MTHTHDDDRLILLFEDQSSSTNPQSRAVLSLHFLYVAFSQFGVSLQLGADAISRLGRRLYPLSSRRWHKNNISHFKKNRTMRYFCQIPILLLIAVCPPAYAVQPDEIMSNAAQEARARNLSRELRCMVCQNQSIDDSDAPLARDLRLLVRERIEAGDSDAQVENFLVSRYGEFVLLKPRFNPHTLLLWLLPPLALLGGGAALWGHQRRRRNFAPMALSTDEESRVAELLDTTVRR